MKILKKSQLKYFLFLLFIFPFVCYQSLSTAQTKWLNYDPDIVTLAGKVIYEKHYGPPGYGENNDDPVYEIPVLQLQKPINVKSDSNAAKDTANLKSYKNITSLQLILPREGSLKGKCLAVTGSLIEGITGQQYTEVLLSVQNVVDIKCSDGPVENRPPHLQKFIDQALPAAQ